MIAIVVGGVTVTSLLITTVVVKSGLWSRRALPVLFVHGWGNTSQIWDVRKYDEAFRDDKRFAFHGYLEATSNGVALRPPDGEMSSVIHPIYRVDLPDGASGNIIDNGKALARSISMVREVTGADSVVLVGFSLGGVICREYVTSEGYANDVKRVITISSPHGGTEFADFASWRRKIAEVQETGSGLNQVGAKALITALDLAADGMGLKLSGEALEMLRVATK